MATSLCRNAKCSGKISSNAGGASKEFTGSATMGGEEIRSVAAKYQSLICNIKASGRKCLDVENEQLRNDFQTFKRQVRNYIQVLFNILHNTHIRHGVAVAHVGSNFLIRSDFSRAK